MLYVKLEKALWHTKGCVLESIIAHSN